MAKHTILRHQPFRALYLTYFFLRLLAKIPIWFARYLVPAFRPHSTWTLSRSILVGVAHEFWGSLKLDPTLLFLFKKDRDKEVADSDLTDAKFVWLEGVSDKLFCGEIRRIAEVTGVQSARIPGYWLLKKNTSWPGGKARAGEKTVLHLHGSAFYIGTAHPSDTTAVFTRGLLQHSHTLERTLAVEYRLSSSAPNAPANPFPAAVLDALAGYSYLVHDLGFDPNNITVLGDSAGANIALALVRHLVENPLPSLPCPGRILVVSGWFDLATSRLGSPHASSRVNAGKDILPAEPGVPLLQYGVRSLLGPLEYEMVQTCRYISPAALGCEPAKGNGGLFEGFPDTYVIAGGGDVLFDDSKALVERMEKDGVNVVKDFYLDAVHDFPMLTWFEPERSIVLQRVAKWLDVE